MFAHAPKAKRSKILKFVTIRESLGPSLRFPTAIPEHLGIALAAAIKADIKVATRIAEALKAAPPKDAAAERARLEAALKRPAAPGPDREELAPGLIFETRAGRAVLSGAQVDETFLEALRNWASDHAKS